MRRCCGTEARLCTWRLGSTASSGRGRGGDRKQQGFARKLDKLDPSPCMWCCRDADFVPGHQFAQCVVRIGMRRIGKLPAESQDVVPVDNDRSRGPLGAEDTWGPTRRVECDRDGQFMCFCAPVDFVGRFTCSCIPGENAGLASIFPGERLERVLDVTAAVTNGVPEGMHDGTVSSQFGLHTQRAELPLLAATVTAKSGTRSPIGT